MEKNKDEKFKNLIPCKNLVDIIKYQSCAKEFGGCGCSVCDNCEDCIEYKLKKLGYCKVDEVRKEIAETILKELKDRSVWFIVGTAQFVQDHFWEQFDEMCNQFGVDKTLLEDKD